MERTFHNAVRILLDRPCKGVLMAVSGGVDSMVMAHLFVRFVSTREGRDVCGPLALAHMNFSLRAAASDSDQDFVKKWSEQQGIPFFTKTVDTKRFAAEEGISVEMAARRLRYEWFEELLAQTGFSYIAVAHNANDRAETMLLNMVRGTGLRGLCGIPSRNDKVVRPLLDIPRDAIEHFASANNISFHVDETNLQTDYARNKIRHLVMPVLEEITPNVAMRMGRNAGNLIMTQRLLDSLACEKKRQIATENGFSIAGLLEDGHGLYWLHTLLQPYGFRSGQMDEIFRSLGGQSGKRFFSDQYALFKDRDQLILRPLAGVSGIPGLEWDVMENSAGLVIPTDLSVACLDADTLPFPLEVRPWEPGDRMIPLGMKGYKKVSDLLTDLKIPLCDKPGVHVLCSGKEIVWVIGLRIDNRFRVTQSTKMIIRYRCKESSPVHPDFL